ncbi:AraC family transcriptional regulator [Gemmiger formicilis]|uniref:AraC family transcriptional regulator n=1 Tax=Gemmiger formicilis TaxID=745368 RepID=UPI00243232CE|nr:helix-turn-helix transcriptional regulator [Gemmiger formicilis]
MLAKFEKRAYAGNEHVWVGKYRNLHNISHWHMEHELIACREGSAQVMLDDTMFNITQQQCIFCHSGCVHYISASPDSLLLVCLFNEKMYDPITPPFTLENPVFEDRYGILPKLSEIRHELQNQPIFFECRTEAMIGEILVDVFRGEPLRKAQWQFSDVITRYKQLLNHIDLEYEHITYRNAVQFMNMSDAYFSRYFKRQAGMTFSQYLNVVRIEKAVQLLDSAPTMKITDVMLRCGFNTIRSFNRVFREVTGFTPTTLPPGYVLNTRSVPTIQGSFDPTLSDAELLNE